jgi:hypothetical protein
MPPTKEIERHEGLFALEPKCSEDDVLDGLAL